MYNPERKGRVNGYGTEAFSLRHEIGTCPNIEVEIYLAHKTPFFITPYHVKEEDIQTLNKEMKRLCHVSISKEGISAPFMLVSRK